MSTYKIITELTKGDNDVWLTTHEDSYNNFTQDEIDNVLIPFKAYVSSLDGLLQEQNSVERIDANNIKLVAVFDTEEHARSAQQKISKTSDIEIVKKKNELFKNKVKALGFTYSAKIYFDFPGQDLIQIV